MKSPLASCALVVCVALALGGCAKKPAPAPLPPEVKNYEAPLPPGQLALRKLTDPRQIPDFTEACKDTSLLRQAIGFSLNYLAKPSSQKSFPYGEITHQQASASLAAFLELLDSGMTPSQINEVIRRQFDVYVSVGCDGKGTVLFTAYYTPIFEASRVRTGKFLHPLYSPPPGLIKLPDGGPATLMPDRRTIETALPYAGHELVWLADPFEAYVAHIQGSAKLRLPDGQELTVGYAANNGHDYRSVREELVKDGKIGRRDGLAAMINYFRAHPGQVLGYTWRNPRFVFFTVTEDGRPRGCLNEPVSLRRSIATDKKIFPPGCLALVSTTLSQSQADGTLADLPYVGFALDQDAGGAIRAPGRCDLYVGVGPAAGDLAGRTQNEGKLYYLFLKASSLADPPPPALVPAVLLPPPQLRAKE